MPVDRPTLIPLDDWRKEAAAGKRPESGTFKGLAGEIKQDEERPRTLRFKLSDASVDRDGDTIDPTGWQLENYQKNPTVLWAHDSRSLPIAKASALEAGPAGLFASATFAEFPFAETVLGLYRGGFLSAVSVGFRPLEWAFNEERGHGAIDFQRQELTEFSAVPIPAHPGALIQARSAGIDPGPLVEWAERVIDETDGKSIYLPKWFREQAPREALAAAVREGKGAPVTVVFRQLGDATTAEIKIGADGAEGSIPSAVSTEKAEVPTVTVTEKLRDDLKRFRHVRRTNGAAETWVVRGPHASHVEIDEETFVAREEDAAITRALVLEEVVDDEVRTIRAGSLGEVDADDAERSAEMLVSEEKNPVLRVRVLEEIGTAATDRVYRECSTYQYDEPEKPSRKTTSKEPAIDPAAIDETVKTIVDDYRMKLTGRLD